MTEVMTGRSSALPFAGPARPLPMGAFARAAARLGCEEAALAAVDLVECGGRGGFLADGRPLILLEAHWIYRLAGPPERGDLCRKSWDRSTYAATGAGEYERLHRAIAAYGRATALKAASWGRGQILGVNHGVCGFATVEGFVEAMLSGEEAQLLAMVFFIEERGLAGPLRRRDWAAFAAGYNGPQFRKNAYDEKLSAAYARIAVGAGDGILSIGDAGGEVISLQRALARAGHAVTPDGDFGRRTRIAVEAFQASRRLEPTGRVDPVTARALGIG